MKKFQLMTILGLFVCVFTFIACGDDNDDTPANARVGSWVIEHSESDDTGQFYWKEVETLTFENNGKFTHLYEGEDGHQGEVRKHGSKEEGTYVYDQNTKVLALTVTGNSYMEPETGKWVTEPSSEAYTQKYQVSINGNELTLTYLREDGEQEQHSTVFKKK